MYTIINAYVSTTTGEQFFPPTRKTAGGWLSEKAEKVVNRCLVFAGVRTQVN